MPKLIKNSEIIDNNWKILEKDFSDDLSSILVDGLVFVPLNYFLNNAQNLAEKLDSNILIGVWLDSDENPESLAPYLDKIKYIAINFPKFTDGRGYSYARILRDRYDYKGELRAIGDILQDQLFFYKRCGFDAFAVREDKDISVVQHGLNDFSNGYQVATDQPLPLFRRR